ncbi:hypothetical protein BCR42DRAFT_494749 [Absidia repens]|uniref:Nucleoporin Nup159/Nup146 N-terminal domain-containing protein n=1 Tax=Absidia repens TaxID=90262 RepID=A0A1X2I599_9FUNG|nr:hypothetical protein BCR42DRAFT_494749 [Absidia repens]
MNSDSIKVVNSHSEEGEFVEVSDFKFMELVVNAKVTMQDVIFKEGEYPATVSLLACSGKYGYFVAGHIDGFAFGETKRLRTAFYDSEEGATSMLDDKIIVPLQFRIHQIRLSCDEQTILVAQSNGTLLTYSAKDVLEQKKDVQPKRSINFPAPIIDLRPNTGALPDAACIFLQNQQCRIVNWKTAETVTDIPILDLTAICWSPKGKRIICGRENGTLEHYDLDGVKQGTIPPPESLKAGDKNGNINRRVRDVLWVDNDQFLVIYSRDKDTESDGSINSAYIIDQKPKSGNAPKCTHLAKLPPIVPSNAVYNHFYMETIRDDTHTIIILANGASNMISAVGRDESGNWATWKLPMDGVASLPLSNDVNYCTMSLGLALDFSACENLPPYDTTNSNLGVEPVPVLYCVNDEGYLGAFHCYNKRLARAGTVYQNMQTATALPPSPTNSASSAFSSDPFTTAMKSGYSGKDFASLEKVKGATSSIYSSISKGLESSSSPKFGSTTSIGAMSSTSTSTSPLSSPANHTFDDASTRMTNQKHATSLAGSMESSDISVVEHSNSTTSSSSGSISSGFEMLNKSDCVSDDAVPETGVSTSKSATTNMEDQVVPTETSLSVKKEPDTTKTTKPTLSATSTNKETAPKLHATSLATDNNNKPMYRFDFESFGSDKKVYDTTPNTNLSLFVSKRPLGDGGDFGNNNMPSFTQLAKKNVPPPSEPTTKKNTPTGTTPTFGESANKNMPAGLTPSFGGFGSPSAAFGKPSAFGEPAKKNIPAGTAPTFGESANTNVPAGTTPTFNDLIKKNAPTAMEPLSGFRFGNQVKNTTTSGGKPSFGTISDGIKSPTTGLPSGFLKLQQPASLSSTTKPSTGTTQLTLKNSTQQQDADYKDKLAATVEPKKASSNVFDDDSYSKILQLVEKLAATQAGFQKQLRSQGDQLDTLVRNVGHLTDNFEKWKSMDRDQVYAHSQMKIDNIKDQTSEVSKPESDLPKTIMTEQVLTTTPKEKEIADVDKILAELHCIMSTDNKKGKQKEVDASAVSVYGFRSAIDQMEKELMEKGNDIMYLKQRLALLRFREHQLKARYSQSTIAFEDLTDEDDDDDEDENDAAEFEIKDPTITDANHVGEWCVLNKSPHQAHQ